MRVLKHLRLLITGVCLLYSLTFLSSASATAFAATKPAPAPFSQADAHLLSSLVPTTQEHVQVNKAILVAKRSGTFEYGNAGRVQAALKSPHLSSALKQAILSVMTNTIVSTPTHELVAAMVVHPSYDPTCNSAPSVYGYIAGANVFHWKLWSYSVRQPFSTDSAYQICAYGGRQVDARTYAPGWALSNEEGNTASCCPADIWSVNNVAVFIDSIYYPWGLVIETMSAHIDMSMYGDGTSDVNIYGVTS